ncbi:tyrosine-type recombinase/integrase [Oceaniserpentilla sp. 4NH20-0058]|uniref:tyrosine-type recombinase/integrase n=1 Tax=Oceaniserpentilla sp. 4NH20-0058 TaxID=3127660 RepID=UPI00334055EC
MCNSRPPHRKNTFCLHLNSCYVSFTAPKLPSKADLVRVEKFQHPTLERVTFRVYSDGLPVRHINRFLSHLDKRDFAPNTVKAYSYDLAQYFRYLDKSKIDWELTSIDVITDFIAYYKHSKSENLSVLPTELGQARTIQTINRCLAAISAFYRYCLNTNVLDPSFSIEIISSDLSRNPKVKEFLSFASASRPQSVSRELKPFRRIKPVLRKVKIISEERQLQLLEFCSNPRDRLLILLLIETGMRIGQVLQLRHSDIESWDSQLIIHPRVDNANEVYSKTKVPYEVGITKKWADMYTEFLINDTGDIDSDYVFTKLYRKDGGEKGEPLTYPSVKDLFERFSRVIGETVTPHMLRHSHATDLLRQNVKIEIVSKRLGHASIETTKKIYEHLTAEDIKRAIFADKGDNLL